MNMKKTLTTVAVPTPPPDQYKWKNGTRYKIAPEVAHAELERIRSIHGVDGELRPEAVIEEARNPSSPIHAEFEWSDDEAAKQYRLAQARKMVGSLTVVMQEAPELECRAFHSIKTVQTAPDQTRNAYHSIRDAMGDPDKCKEMLRNAKLDAAAFRLRHQHLVQMSRVIAAIDDLLK